ncbi:hypothetical protein [Acinetobacter gandensis]|uniref:hypothetical protein n=1 Tax=Acinetobacter gandensis TaxID=1443941 RepID=UPI0039891A17
MELFTFDNEKNNKYESPSSLTQSEDIQQCSGQGIYVLTDGEPNSNSGVSKLASIAINKSGFSCTSSSDGWDCTNKMNAALIDPNSNGKGLKFKTAVVGFGNAFNNIASFDKTKTEAENIAALGTINTHVKRAARWGILGQGGWYSGQSSQDVVESVNDFISNLSKDIPSVTTGSPTIPRDALNPAELQNNAYYQTFQPTPNTNYQLWLGNLKKYLVGDNGVLKGKNSATVFETDGRIKEPTYDANGNITSAVYDYWAKSVDTAVENSDENTVGSSLLHVVVLGHKCYLEQMFKIMLKENY